MMTRTDPALLDPEAVDESAALDARVRQEPEEDEDDDEGDDNDEDEDDGNSDGYSE
jgi:hypothetical protein